jgi:hypothetical protein
MLSFAQGETNHYVGLNAGDALQILLIKNHSPNV